MRPFCIKECNLPLGSLLKSAALVLYKSQQKMIEIFDIWACVLAVFDILNGHPLLFLES